MIEVAAEYAALAACVVAFLTLLGWPIGRLLRTDRGAAIPAPILGLSALPLLSWYWLRATGQGLHVGVVVLVPILVVLDATLLFRDRTRLRIKASAAAVALLAIAAIGLCAVNFESVLHVGYVTTVASTNNDAPDWVQSGQHVADLGLDAPGNVENYDFGEAAESSGFGGIVLISAATTLSQLESWQVGSAVLFAAVALVLAATASFVQRMSGLSRSASILISGACLSPMLFFYIAGNFFLAQLIAMAVLPCIALKLIDLADSTSRQDTARHIATLGFLLFALLSTYAHTTFLSLLLLAPVAAFVGERRQFVRRAGRVGVRALAGLAVALLAAPDLTGIAIERAVQLGKVEAGWRLPAFLPVDLLGFGRQIEPRMTAWRVAASAVIVIGAAALAGQLWRRGTASAGHLVVTIAVTLGSYGLLYWREGGDTYRQWKWITYLQPMFAASVLSIVAMKVLAVATAHSRRLAPRTRRALRPAGEVVVGCLAVGLIVINTFNGQPVLGPVLRGARPNLVVDTDLVDLERSPSLDGITEVNVDTADFWTSMWASYFFRDKTVFLVQPSYYVQSPPRAAWTLDRVDRGPLPPQQESIPINSTYRLVEQTRGPVSSAAAGLDGSLQITSDDVVDGRRTIELSVRNDGTTVWLPGHTADGGVRLGGSIVDAAGNVTSVDFLRADLAVLGSIAPGWTTAATVVVDDADLGTGRLMLQLIAENAARFGETIEVDPSG